MVLHTDYPAAMGASHYEMLGGERRECIVSEEDEEYEYNDDYNNGSNCNAPDSGSENAPEDSAYISDEDEY